MRRKTPLEAPLCSGQASGLSSVLSEGWYLSRTVQRYSAVKEGWLLELSLWLSCNECSLTQCVIGLAGRKEKLSFRTKMASSLSIICIFFKKNHRPFLFGNMEYNVNRINTK